MKVSRWIGWEFRGNIVLWKGFVFLVFFVGDLYVLYVDGRRLG